MDLQNIFILKVSKIALLRKTSQILCLFHRFLKKGNTANTKAGLILSAANAQPERGVFNQCYCWLKTPFQVQVIENRFLIYA